METDPGITRRDFLNAALLGAGATLLDGRSPLELLAGGRLRAPGPPGGERDPWWGYGAVGDYADSAGNTRAVMEAAHRIRDGAYDSVSAEAVESGESVDLLVVGGGMSGLGAAWHFRRRAGDRGTCLVLENHPVFGGEAKRNEFDVDGVRLVAPQGSNDFGIPARGSGSLADEFFAELRIPREFRYREPPPGLRPLDFALDNYAHLAGIAEARVDVGYRFGGSRDGAGDPGEARSGRWVTNIWRDDLARAPFSREARRDLLRWRREPPRGEGEAFRRRLDRFSYAAWLEEVLGLSPAVTRYVEPIIGLINGASPDAVSAFAAHQIGMPGVSRPRDPEGSLPHSFPGGNSALARYAVKGLIPDAIGGAHTFADVLNRGLSFEALDRPGSPTRIRPGATVVRVEHDGTPTAARGVRVTYEKGGKLYRVRARAVVMASGGWVNRRVVRDLPAEVHDAYERFVHAPALVANVALRNWRFLYERGVTACRWLDGGFGFSCNLRRPMLVGDHRPPLHPDRPVVLTFYTGIYAPGLSAREQGIRGRRALLTTPFSEYEARLREQLSRTFGDAGFDPERDIAGLVLNRWGHARLVQPPGFHFGRDGRPSPREVVEAGFGRIAIGHSELNGHQNWTGGLERGRRAVEQLWEVLEREMGA